MKGSAAAQPSDAQAPGEDPQDLDFTQGAAERPSIPLAHRRYDDVRAEASEGTARLESAGYYVAIARRARVRASPRDGNRYSLLVIEDDMALAGLVRELFAKAGFAVRAAANRAEINQGMRTVPLPDLILLDIALPDADGFAILERLRSHRLYGAIPVVLMTGRSDPADVLRGLALGADGYVAKPFRLASLASAVESVLGLA